MKYRLLRAVISLVDLAGLPINKPLRGGKAAPMVAGLFAAMFVLAACSADAVSD